MPFPAPGLLPSSLLYPLDAGIDFIGFSKDFTLLLDRYGRTLQNHRTTTIFSAILKILDSTRCLGDGRQMECGDAILYTLPALKYQIGDHISPVSGRGEWVIVAEKYASRIGDLRIFRTIGLERYTPNATLEGLYTIVASLATEITSLYDIKEKLAQIIGLRVEPDLVNNILSYWNAEEDENLSYYKVHRATSSGFSPSDNNLVGIPRTNFFAHNDLDYAETYYFRVCAVTKLGTSGTYSAEISATTSGLIIPSELRCVYDITAELIVGVEFGGLYDLTQKLTTLELLCRFDIHALDVPGIELSGIYDLREELVRLDMSSRFDIFALDVPGIELIGIYDLRQELVSLEMSSRFDILALDVPGIELTGRYNLTQELLGLGITSRYDIIALDGAYPATTLYPSTSLYPRGPGKSVDIMSTEFAGLYDITKEIISLEMSSRFDIHALDVPGIELIGSYDLTEELVAIEMLSRFDIKVLDVPGIELIGSYDLTQELVTFEMVGLYDIISKDVTKEMVSSYDITKTPAQIAGERAVATGDMIDNYWNPWDDVDLSYYKVHRSLNNGFAPSDANLVGVPTTNAFKHSNLAAPVQYYFKVCAVTKLGVSGTYSAQFTATTA